MFSDAPIPNLALTAEAAHKGLAFQAAAKQFSSACTTLQKHLYDHKRSGNEQLFYSYKRAVCTVFSTEEKGKLMDYTTTARNIYYELTRKEVMKLA
jgi:hypothetical protein